MRSSLIKLHIAVFLWGFTGVLGKTIQLDEVLLVWYRLLITLVVLFVFLLYRKELPLLPFKIVLKLTGIGSIIVLHWLLFYGCIKMSNVSIALTCLSSAGFFTAILEPIFNNVKIKLIEVLLGLLGVLGIYLIFHFDPRYQMGIIVGIGATISSVVFSIMNKKVVKTVAPKTVMLYQLGGGWLVLTLLLPIFGLFKTSLSSVPSVSDWIWLTVLSVFCTVLAMDLSLQALKKVSAFTQSLTLNLEPVYGIILAFIVYHENKYLNAGFYVGFGLIILSVVLQMQRILNKKYQHN